MEGPRGLKKSELKSAESLVNSIFRSNEKDSMIDDFPLLYSSSNLDNIRVYVNKGEVVSLVGSVIRDINVFGNRFRAAEIGSVCTAPEYRGKGLASSLMVDAERISISKGASVMFISGDLGLYRRFGAVGAGTYFMYTLRPELLEEFNPIDVRIAKRSDIPFLSRMHNSKSVRFERTVEQFELIFNAVTSGQVIPGSPVKILVSECGYLVLTHDEKGIVNCVEHAGDTLCIIEMLKAIFEERRYNSAILHTTGDEYGLNRLLSRISQFRIRNLLGTIKVIEPAKLGESLASYFSQRTSARIRFSSDYTLEVGRYVFRPSAKDFTRIVFGSTEKLEEYNGLKELVRNVLPIPLPDYGLDYV